MAAGGLHRWWLAVVALTAAVARARFVVEKSSVRVVAPKNMRGHHDAAIANFGVPNYGGVMTGVVKYPDKNQNGCAQFDAKFKSGSRRPVILLLDRGDCYFALKAFNGQSAGAGAVLIADDKDEALLTMDTPESAAADEYITKIAVPSALITREFGDSLKAALRSGEQVIVKLDWRESMPHPDERVEYELWTNSNDECGERCDQQMSFLAAFRGHAQLLERGGFAQFTPHYITWFCPDAFRLSAQCRSQCINRGRYCAPDPENDFSSGYEGKDVVVENLRQLCVHRVANETGHPWIWWDYVTDYHARCSMKEKKHSNACAELVVRSLGLDLDKVQKCIGDPEADAENAVLTKEQQDQIGHDNRGDVTMLPTLVINDIQYRGKLESAAVLKAICAGFKETTEPHVCLVPDMETNECLRKNGGCWQDAEANLTACKDTYRGRLCECPVVNGVHYEGDGYTFCKAVGPGRCSIDNGGCWTDTRGIRTFSACSETTLSGCFCPPGFRGDGHRCEDIDECKERLACSCPECECMNTWGGYECSCKGKNLLYLKAENACIANNTGKVAVTIVLVLLSCVLGVGLAGYLLYRYRLRSYMDSEIMAIMSQYMPIDGKQEAGAAHSESLPLQQEDEA